MSRASALSPPATPPAVSTDLNRAGPDGDANIPGFLECADPRLGLLSSAAYTVVLLFPHTS